MSAPTPLSLPEPSTAQLVPAPLALVVCQVQHDRALAAADPTRALSIRDDLLATFGGKLILEEQAQQEITLAVPTPGKVAFPVPSERLNGWQIRSDDQHWVVVIMPDFFALECTGYTTWTNFRERFQAITSAVVKHVTPSIEKRLGLRCVDRIEQPQVRQLRDWQRFVNERLLGPVLDDTIGPSIISSQQVVHLAAQDPMEVILRHGVQHGEKGSSYYLIDTDCYRADTRKLEQQAITDGAQDLHRLALQVFQAALTSEFIAQLHGED